MFHVSCFLMLYLVATPIGNLRDITLRALDILKMADLIVCEDTRQTQKLLSAYEISKPLTSFHEHSGQGKLTGLVDKLKAGENLAFVTDGGMPVISDPGFELVRECLKEKIKMEVLPGPNAAVTALAGSGLACYSFSFFGFLPQKSAARKNLLKSLIEREETLIFYESPYRLLKVLQDMQEIFGEREAVVARELTKKFEEFSRGLLADLVKIYAAKKPLGEIVILVSGANRKRLFALEST